MTVVSCRARGFTLIELMVVVMLIAVAAAVVAPGLADQVRGARIRGAARDFCSLCALARSTAAREVKDYEVAIDYGKRQLLLRQKDGGEVALSLAKRELPEGIRAGSASGSNGSGEIGIAATFFPDGTASGDGAVFSEDSGRRLKVSVDAITGRAKVEG